MLINTSGSMWQTGLLVVIHGAHVSTSTSLAILHTVMMVDLLISRTQVATCVSLRSWCTAGLLASIIELAIPGRSLATSWCVVEMLASRIVKLATKTLAILHTIVLVKLLIILTERITHASLSLTSLHVVEMLATVASLKLCTAQLLLACIVIWATTTASLPILCIVELLSSMVKLTIAGSLTNLCTAHLLVPVVVETTGSSLAVRSVVELLALVVKVTTASYLASSCTAQIKEVDSSFFLAILCSIIDLLTSIVKRSTCASLSLTTLCAA